VNNTGIFDPAPKVRSTFHGLAGVSDILGILPQTARLADGGEAVFGVFLAVEVKRPGESLRPDQEAFLNDIRARGGIGVCVRSLDDLEAQLRPFLVR
jgi:hypothetical protein